MTDNREVNPFEETTSIYTIMLKKSPNDIIKKYLNNVIDKTDMTGERVTKIEKTLSEITKIIVCSENMTLLKMVDEMNTFNTDINRDEFIEYLKSKTKKRSNGKVTIDKYGLSINYIINTDGSIEFIRVVDLYNHQLDGEGITAKYTDLDKTELCIEFWKAFSATYPVIDTKKSMTIDFSLIAKNSNGKLAILDTINIFRDILNTGWARVVKTRINAGFINYLQVIQILDFEKVPILGLFGRLTRYIPIHNSIIDKDLSDIELENNFELFAHLQTSFNIMTMPTGDFGIICDGEMVVARRKSKFVYDIINIKNRKKVKRFKGKHKFKHGIDEKHKDPYVEDEGDNIVETVIKSNVRIHSNISLYAEFLEYMMQHHKYLKSDGAQFWMPHDEASMQNLMYKPDTLWKDFITEDRLEGESDKMYNKRQGTLGNMNNRFVTQFCIDGMCVSKNGLEYAATMVNNINGIKKCDIIKPLDYEQLLEMTVSDVVDLDTKYSFIKPYCSFKNKQIKNSNKIFKEEIMQEYLTGNDGKKIKPAEILNKNKFINNRLNNVINKLIKQQNNAEETNENTLETLLKAKSIKEYDEKINILNYDLGLDINIEELERDYLAQKNIYNNFISQVQTYENTDKLSIRTKLDIFNIIEEHNKLTGNNLQIQNFKIQVVDLSNEIIKENKEIIKETSNKESKKLLRETNANLRKLNKANKQNLYILSSYENYITSKIEIKLEETCNNLNNQIKRILEDENINKSEEYKYKLNTMVTYIENITNKEYAVEHFVSYSKNLFSMNNRMINCRECDYMEYRRLFA